jgi:MtN3 and saliva related transmembrane protein
MANAPVWVIDAFGVTAGCCSMLSFIPQIVKMVRERDAEGVSLKMYAVTIFGFCCWTAYGLLSGAWPVAASNAICIVLTAAIFILRLHFGDAGANKRR